MDSRKPARGSPARANLVIRPEKLGDLVVATPVFRAFKETFPDQPLHLLTDEASADLVARDPHIDRILRIPWRGRLRGQRPSLRALHAVLREGGSYQRAAILYPNWEGWNWLLAARGVPRVAQLGGTASACLLGHASVLRHDFRAGESVVDLFLAVAAKLGAATRDPLPRLYVTEEEREAVARRFPFLRQSGSIFVHAFSMTAAANLSPASYFSLCSHLAEKNGRPIQLLGTREEMEKAALPSHPGIGTELVGRLNLRELMAACTHAAVLVGGSSGIIHIGAALGVPTLGLYCPGDNHPQAWGPRGPWARTLVAPAPLCRRMGAAGATASPCGAPGFCDLGFAFPHQEVSAAIEERIAAKAAAGGPDAPSAS